MEILIIYFASCLCLYLLVTLIKFFYNVWWTPLVVQSLMKAQGIKGPPYRFIYGNTREIINMRSEMMKSPMDLSHNPLPRIHPHFYLWRKLFGTNFLMWYGPKPRLVVNETELVKEVFMNKNGAYPKLEDKEYGYKLLGDGLASTIVAEKWFKLRNLSNHAFHSEKLKNMIPEMIASMEMMLKRWRNHEGKEIEVFQEFKILTSEEISRAAFGSSYLEGQQIFDMLMKMGIIIARNAYKIRIPVIGKLVKTRDDIESEKLEQGIKTLIIKMMKQREEAAMSAEVDGFGSDFLGIHLKAYHEADKGKKISLDDLIDQCKTFYVAGQETTATSLTWTVLLLAMHTDWQDRAREEVLELFGTQNPTSEGIAKLKIMSMIINEALRLYPPVVELLRNVERKVKLGRLTVPANTEVSVSILAIHHNPEIWGEDVHLFKPERFAEGVAKATNNNLAAFLPFGLGPRTCVGLNFAIIEKKIALSMILQHYRFTLSPSYVHSPFQLLTICPQNGVQVILQSL